MRGWCIGVVLGILVGMLVPVPIQATVFEDCIYGYVYTQDTDDPVVDMEIQFIELTTNATGYTTTDETGFYYFDLNEFETWATGDYVKLTPPNYCNYYVCHPSVYLDDSITAHSYEMNLLATPSEQPFYTEPGLPIPLPVPTPNVWYYNSEAGSINTVNRNYTKSYVDCVYVDDDPVHYPVIIPASASGVRICITPCYQDNGTNISGQGYYSVNCKYDLYVRVHDTYGWGTPDNTEKDYVIHQNENKGANFPNLLGINLSRADCVQNTYDIRLSLHVNWDTGNFNKPREEASEYYVKSNVKFSFTGVG